jgi:hypothetical protein
MPVTQSEKNLAALSVHGGVGISLVRLHGPRAAYLHLEKPASYAHCHRVSHLAGAREQAWSSEKLHRPLRHPRSSRQPLLADFVAAGYYGYAGFSTCPSNSGTLENVHRRCQQKGPDRAGAELLMMPLTRTTEGGSVGRASTGRIPKLPQTQNGYAARQAATVGSSLGRRSGPSLPLRQHRPRSEPPSICDNLAYRVAHSKNYLRPQPLRLDSGSSERLGPPPLAPSRAGRSAQNESPTRAQSGASERGSFNGGDEE